jgi:hypothetical protein
MRLGDITELIIKLVTLGQGKRIATFVAKLFGYKTCNCDKRRVWLNNLFLPEDKKQYPI